MSRTVATILFLRAMDLPIACQNGGMVRVMETEPEEAPMLLGASLMAFKTEVVMFCCISESATNMLSQRCWWPGNVFGSGLVMDVKCLKMSGKLQDSLVQPLSRKYPTFCARCDGK